MLTRRAKDVLFAAWAAPWWLVYMACHVVQCCVVAIAAAPLGRAHACDAARRQWNSTGF